MKNLAAILIGVGCGLSLTGWSVSAQAATLVDLELAFILDSSNSISDDDWTLQKNAYQQIFTDPNFYATYVQPLLGKKLATDDDYIGIGKIAVSVFQFADTVQQNIGWTIIEEQADATAFGNQFLSVPKIGGVYTSLGKGIQVATQSITGNNIDSFYQVFDLSSDGVDDPNPDLAIIPLVAAIEAEQAGVDVMNVIGTPVVDKDQLELIKFGKNLNGSDAFLLEGDSISQYETLLAEKIKKELTPPTSIPEPHLVLGLLSLGFLGVGVKLPQKVRK